MSHWLQLSMALSVHERVQIVIPAQGMMDMCSILIELFAEHGPHDSGLYSIIFELSAIQGTVFTSQFNAGLFFYYYKFFI